MINKRTLIAYIGHHPDLSIAEVVKNLNSIYYKEVVAQAKKWGVSFGVALAAMFAEETPHCPVCNEPRRQVNTFKLKPTCGKECDYELRVSKSRKTKIEKLNSVPALLKTEMPWGSEVVEAIKSLCSSTADWIALVVENRPDLKADYFEAGAVSWNKLHFRYFLETGTIKCCVECGKGLSSPKSNRCKGECASKYGMQEAHKTLSRAYGCVGFAIDRVKEKARSTMKQTHGVEYSWQSEELKAKSKSTMKRLYGFERPCDMPHVRKAFDERYKDPEFVARVRRSYEAAMDEKYGEDWRSVMADKMARVRYKFKEVVLQRKLFTVQGYEPFVLQELVARGCKANDIAVYSRSFKYINPLTKQRAIYRPDIIIEKLQLIIEVKSTYTAGLNKNGQHLWNELIAKSKVVAEAGEQLTLVVVSPKTGYFSLRDPHLYTRKQVLSLLQFKPFTRA